jgi:hypothetical protein
LFIIQGLLAGFRIHARQVSKQRNKYLGKFTSLAEKRGIADVIRVCLLCVVTYFMPGTIKRKLNNRIIYYEGGQWMKKKGGTATKD